MIADSGLSTQELVVKMVMTHVDDALPQQGTRFEPSTFNPHCDREYAHDKRGVGVRALSTC